MSAYDLNYEYHGKVDIGSFYCLYRYNGLITVVNAAKYDMFHYDGDSMIKNKKNEIHLFENKDLAIMYLKKWYKNSEIEEEYRNYSGNVRDTKGSYANDENDSDKDESEEDNVNNSE